jgi:hypothetical protein
LYWILQAPILPHLVIDEFVKSQNWDGKVKSSSSRRREFRRMRRTYVRRSEHEMKRNAEIGLFAKPSVINTKQLAVFWITFQKIW